MKLAAITNWAYGATVILTLISGATMLFASSAQEHERAAVAQRYNLDQVTSKLDADMRVLTGQVRQYVITGNTIHLVVYDRELKGLADVEGRVRQVKVAGASASELTALKDALHWADNLHAEQQAAIAAYKAGKLNDARAIAFGAEYERELDRVGNLLERFRYHLDQRTSATVNDATNLARIWKLASEITLSLTALLFLCVLYFVFKRRVLSPVVKLSDVVGRLAAENYDEELPVFDQVDEIGDMAQAIRVFRENGLERQRLERELSADLSIRNLLTRMTQRMQGCDELRDLEDVIQRFVPEIAPTLAGRLYLHDEARNAMVEACCWLSPAHSRSEFSPIACWALRRGVPHRPSGANIDVPCEHLDMTIGEPVDSICLPLTSQRETLGLLYFEPVGNEAAIAREVPEIYLKMLAENIGLALANLRLRGTLRGLAMADPLTGLANRRSLKDTLGIEIAEAERLERPLSCLMLDIDHFKLFNDKYGHAAGDAVLSVVGKTLADATRESGMAFRYGGEEFLLLMPGLDASQAFERAELVRHDIAALAVRYEGQTLPAITVSVGVASAPEHGPAIRLVQNADAALLEAKAAGRNLVTITSVRDRRDDAVA